MNLKYEAGIGMQLFGFCMFVQLYRKVEVAWIFKQQTRPWSSGDLSLTAFVSFFNVLLLVDPCADARGGRAPPFPPWPPILWPEFSSLTQLCCAMSAKSHSAPRPPFIKTLNLHLNSVFHEVVSYIALYSVKFLKTFVSCTETWDHSFSVFLVSVY